MRSTRIVFLIATYIFLGGTGTPAEPPKKVKEFTLTAKEMPLRLASGKVVTAWAYNGQIPGQRSV